MLSVRWCWRGLTALILVITGGMAASADPIRHDVYYPAGAGPFPAVIALHTSGGYQTVRKAVPGFVDAGYAVYTPDFFARHGLSAKTRFETWTTYREAIEAELVEIVQVMRQNPKIDPDNIYAVGYSNGGYWASFLAARGHVNAGVSTYGVWSWPNSFNGFPAGYFDAESHPLLALHGRKETVQRIARVLPQIENAMRRSLAVRYHIFDDAGHSWDCRKCKKDGYNPAVTATALRMTLDFFAANRR